jgi:hypothetical protein
MGSARNMLEFRDRNPRPFANYQRPKAGLSPTEQLAWARYSRDAHGFIFGLPDAPPVLYTKDEHRPLDPVQPFPDLPYLRCLLDCLLVSGRFVAPTAATYALDWGIPALHLERLHAQGLLFLEKSRQVMASWLCVAYLLWRAKFFPHQLLIVQSRKEEDAAKFVYLKEPQQARMSFLELHLPRWLQDGCFHRGEMSIGRGGTRTSQRADYGNLFFRNGSRVWAVPQGGDVIRSNTPSCLFSDECAFQPEFGLAYAAALPSIAGGGQLIAVSSAEVGEFANLVEAPL